MEANAEETTHGTRNNQDNNVNSLLSITMGIAAEIENLIQSGADVNDPYQSEVTDFRVLPLHIAIKTQSIVILKMLLEIDGCNVNIGNGEGRTPLHTAVDAGFTEGVRLLLAHGANPNVADSSSLTPIDVCLRDSPALGKYAILGLLLSHGADVNGAHCRLLRAPQAKDSVLSPAKYAACTYDTTALRIVMDAKPSLSYDPWNLSPLEAATVLNREQVIMDLLGGNCHKGPSLPGDDSIHLAVLFGHTRALQLLCEARKEFINKFNHQSYTPVFIACQKNNINALNILVINGADLSLPVLSSPNSVTPLHKAVLDNNYNLTETLIHLGVDIDQSCGSYQSPIFHALSWSQVEVSTLLICHGCVIDNYAFYAIRWKRLWKLLPLIHRAGYLHQAVALVRHMPAALRKESGIQVWIKDVISNASALKDLCRAVIRNNLTRPMVYSVKELGLPLCLQRTLLMDNE